MSDERFQSFEEFWPYYVRQHQKKLTRQLHFLGTSAAIGCALGGLLTRQRWLLLGGLVAGYAPAWLSHFVVEGNRPATFRYPLLSLRADLLMWCKMLEGTMDAEVERILESDRAEAPHEAKNGWSTVVPSGSGPDGRLN